MQLFTKKQVNEQIKKQENIEADKGNKLYQEVTKWTKKLNDLKSQYISDEILFKQKFEADKEKLDNEIRDLENILVTKREEYSILTRPLDDRINKVMEEEEKLDTKQHIIDRQNEAILIEKTNINERKEELDKKENAIIIKEKNIDERVKSLKVEWEKMEDYLKELNKKSDKFDNYYTQKNKEIDDKLVEIGQKEAILNAREDVIDNKIKELEKIRLEINLKQARYGKTR